MKRLLMLSILVFLSLTQVFADDDSAEATMQISAYKSTATTTTGYVVTLTNWNSEELSGMEQIYTLLDEEDNVDVLGDTYTLANAFTVMVSSNVYQSNSLTLTFTPFINQDDSSDTIPAVYTVTYDDNEIEYETTSKSGRTTYYYKYLHSASMDLSAGDSLTVSETTSTTLTRSVTTQRCSKTRKNGSYGSYGDYSISTGSTLSGVSDVEDFPTYAYFQLSISSDSYSSMTANADYLATVTVTITSD